MSQPEPLTEQQLTPDREQKIRRNYADCDSDFTVNVLLAEIDRLRAELAEMRAARDVIASMYRDADSRLDAVTAFCDAAEKQATRWEHPLPVPEWVAEVRRLAAAPAPSTAPLDASQPSEVRGEGETAARAATGRTGDPLPATDDQPQPAV